MFCVGVYVRVHGLCCAVPRDASGDPSRILDDGKMCIRTCVRVCALALCSKTFLLIVSTYTVTSFSTTLKVTPEMFIFPKSKHPGVDMIDNRI